jgi:glucose-6-phosphate 1-epimerase
MTAIAMTTYGALPAICIRERDGAEAIVTLYGAHLVSWKTADGVQRLFCSAKSALDGSRAIRGGVPVIFPQFAERGTGMRHGFARVSTWRVAAQGDGWAEFALTDSDLAPALRLAWPHGFALSLRVALERDALTLTLDVHNTGSDAFTFSSALHTYYQVDAIGGVTIGGLPGGALRISDKIDQIFRGVTQPLTLAQASGTLTLTQTGFQDAVVWNPGEADTKALADMEDDEYLRCVCIEPAQIDGVTLAPAATWRGGHHVRAA